MRLPNRGRQNPIKSARQYGMVASVLSGQSKTISQQLAEDMMRKTPPNKRSKFAKELAKRRRNPEDEDLGRAKRVSEDWHGRKSRNITEVEEVERYQDTLAELADLEELGVLNQQLERWQILFKIDRPKVAADLKQKNLEFVGGNQSLDFDNKYTKGKNEILVGYCYQIVYESDKHHLEGSNGYPESYEHFFGEEFYKKQGYSVEDFKTSDDYFEAMLEEGVVEKAIELGYLPIIVYDCVNCKIRLVGGKYDIQDVGIVD